MSLFPLALAFLLGVSLIQGMAELHTEAWLVGLVLLLLAGFVRQRPHSWQRQGLWLLCLVFAGALWASWRAELYLAQRLPEAFAGQDLLVTGRVSDIPVLRDRVQRFTFEIEQLDPASGLAAVPRPPQKLRLSWYHSTTAVNAGERWQLRLRLKPPHGFLNPGGFDYESWLYQQGIHATGYVRTADENRLLAAAPAASLLSLRQKVLQHITQVLAEHPQRGVITALAVGEREGINQAQWQQLLSTGTNHLVAISGLHIGLAAGFAYVITRRVVARLLPAKVLLRIPAQHLAIIAALLAGLLYALLAGMSLPTQRALLMLASFSAASLLRRNQWAFDALGLAMLVVLLWQPVSVLAPGFWFSFLAVAVIFYVFADRGADDPPSRQQRWLRWGGIQFAIALALLPLSLFMFQQSSLVAPLANLIMVPYVSLLVVPLVLLALVLLPFWSWASAGLLWLAASLMQLIWPLLEALASLDFAFWVRPQPALWSVLLAMCGIAWLLAPRTRMPHHLLRAAGIVLILPMLLVSPDKPAAGDFELHQLDVGQGLAIVVRTRNHALVYDTGARLGAELDAGSAVVVPFLRQLGVSRLDTLVVSHGDADHIGGAASVLQSFAEANLLGRDIESLTAAAKSLCTRGQHWHWDGVDFEFLHPPAAATEHGRRNNHSCILRISNAAGAALLTGDIERSVELQMLSADVQKLAAAVIVVPHHGSKTSSTAEFIAAVKPDYALFSAGYRNRYRHPAADIVARYRAAGAIPLVSGLEGAVSIEFSTLQGVRLLGRFRRDQRHYWNHLLTSRDE